MPDEQKEKVAVVVVHGVAAQTPSHNPRLVTQLLQGLTFETSPEGNETDTFPKEGTVAGKVKRKRYSGWTEEPFQIAAQPENRPLMAGDAASVDVAFTHELLKDYVPSPSDGVYSSVKFSGKRLFGARSAETGETPVDIYELYWSDLSTIGSKLLRVLTSLYSLIFHLTEVGRITLMHADNKVQARLYSLHSSVGWLLGRVLPLLYTPVFFLLVGLGMLSFVTPVLRVVVALLPALALLGAAVVRAQKNSDRGVLALGGLALGVGVGLYLGVSQPESIASIFCGEWLVVTLVGTALVTGKLTTFAPSAQAIRNQVVSSDVNATERRRDAGISAGVAVIFALLAWWVFYGLAFPKAIALLPIALFFYRAWLIGVMLTGTLALVNACTALVKRLTLPEGKQVYGTVLISSLAPFAFSVWLGNALLSLGAKLIYLICYLNLNSGTLQALIKKELRKESIDHLTLLQGQAERADVFFAPPGVAAMVACCLLVVGGVILFFAFLPSVLQEARSPQSAKTPARVEQRGRWLSWGYKGLWGTLLCLIVSALLACFASVWAIIGKPLELSKEHITSSVLVSSTGVLVLVVLFFFRDRVSQVLGSIVGVGIDVDNHLRAMPAEATPRARIFNRYVSLLRYLAWQDYTKIVIVAHSQGSVLTAELLRYLNAVDISDHSALSRLRGKLVLFTMGSPLRQLYALRFPKLYAWVVGEKGKGPDPKALFGVSKWVNAYRSGDYIGRRLAEENGVGGPVWNTDPVVSEEGLLTEFCIGEGAHTHYWDWSAPDIALTLDRLIAGRASSGGPP